LQQMQNTPIPKKKIKNLVGLNRSYVPKALRHEYDKIIDNLVATGRLSPMQSWERKKFRKQLNEMAKAHIENEDADTLSQKVSDLGSLMAAAAPEIAETSHQDVMARLFRGETASSRVAALHQLNWRLQAHEPPLILADCMAVSVSAEGVASPLLFTKDEVNYSVYIPINGSKLLIGETPGHRLSSDFDFNHASATVAHTFFLGGQTGKEFAAAHALIGSHVDNELANSNHKIFR
jgi:hypothetical protein